MWMTFLPDLLVAAIGAVLTVAVAFGTYRLTQRQQEVQSLRDLIDDLHHRRAFSVQPSVPVLADEDTKDFIWATQSVIAARDLTSATRRAVRAGSKARPHLSTIIAACNEYLESSPVDPSGYVIDLMSARDRIIQALEEIVEIHGSLTFRAPGTNAYLP